MSDPATMTCPRCSTRFDAGATFCPKDGTRLMQAASDPLVGAVLAERYQVVRLIGQGGMGRVYEAQHVNITKRLALKVLHPEAMADPVMAARFRLEARSASKIGHENIVAIDDSATLSDGTVYLAMEFLEGESLAERMRRSPPLTLAEAVAIMVPVCRGLAAAHAAQIVHRDMKPENIFLAKKGDRVIPKILDFGIAKVLTDEGALHLTRTGAIFGTPAYMSPQQAEGLRIDHRTDIYSVGVILFELFAGRLPFVADLAVQLLHQHIATDPPRPSLLSPARRIPRALDDLVLRALSKDPAARQQSMDVLADELSAAIAVAAPVPVPVASHAIVPAPVAAATIVVSPASVAARVLASAPATAVAPGAATVQLASATMPDVPARLKRKPLVIAIIALSAVGAVLAIALGFSKPASPTAAIAPATIDAGTTAATATGGTTAVHGDGPVTSAAKGTGHTIKEAAKTGGGSVRDGSRTVGRTVRSFFKEGPKGAKETWKENAATTKENARSGGKKTKAAASDL